MEKQKINVVLINDNFEPCVDGVVKTVLNYANLLSKDSVVSVVCPKYDSRHDNYDFPIYRVPSFKLKKSTFAIALKLPHIKLRKILKKQKPSIIHVHSPFLLGHFGIRLAKKLKIPIVTTFHSKYKDDFIQFTNNNKFLVNFGMKYIMKFYNKCDVVWACSQETAKTLESYGYKNEIKIMPNGTDYIYPDNIDALIENAKNKFNIDQNKNNILFVGQLIWQKNLRLVIDVYSELLKLNKNYHFYFVGTSAFEKQVKEYAKSKGIYENTTFTGVINDSNLLKGIYASCDLFFFPSLYDNAPLVLREASVLKMPTLVTRGATCSEIIVDNQNGFIEEGTTEKMTERIDNLFKDKNILKKCGLIASKTIPVTWDKIIEDVKKEYIKIIDAYNKEERR